MLPRCCYQFTFETFKYLYFLNFNYFFLHLHLNWKRHTASISHLIKYLLPIMREHIGFITSNTFIIAFIKFTSKCMALKSWAKFVSSSFTWLVDVTTLEMARKPVKLQKENPAFTCMFTGVKKLYSVKSFVYSYGLLQLIQLNFHFLSIN